MAATVRTLPCLPPYDHDIALRLLLEGAGSDKLEHNARLAQKRKGSERAHHVALRPSKRTRARRWNRPPVSAPSWPSASVIACSGGHHETFPSETSASRH